MNQNTEYFTASTVVVDDVETLENKKSESSLHPEFYYG